jgi:hypothetical protein
MADDNQDNEPKKTQEELDEEEIRLQTDSVEIQAVSCNDPIQNVIYTAVVSATLDKKVVTTLEYTEEMEDGKIKGRSLTSFSKKTVKANDKIDTINPVVIKQRPVDRGE